MKRLLIALLAACLILTGCGGSTSDDTDETEASEETASSAYETAEEAAEEEEEEEEETEEEDDGVVIEEAELEIDILFYEDEYFSLRGTLLSIDDEGVITLTLEVCNNTDEEVDVYVTEAELNLLEDHPMAYIYTDAGETETGEVEIDGLNCAITDLSQITQVGITMMAYPESYEWITSNEHCTGYIYGEDAAVEYEHETDDDDIILLDNDDVTIMITDLEYDDYYSPRVYVTMYIKSYGSDGYIAFGKGDTSINGVELESAFDATFDCSDARYGNGIYVTLTLYTEEYDVTSLEELENLSIYIYMIGYDYTNEEHTTISEAFYYEGNYEIEF